mmetsp:Transcript_101267/g.123986  ORF Transcript_101267/g.123986 Transcript_101267/m.123986 type:complete len:332 (-) Transcript_101267:164-1159(-)
MLRDGMCLHSDDLPPIDAHRCAVADALLIPLDALLVHHRPRAYGHMVALGEDPGVEIRRYIFTHIHLGTVLVVIHLLLRDFHTFLEGNGIFIVTSLNVFGHTAVGPIGPNDHIHFQGLFHTLSSVALFILIVIVGQDIRLTLLLRQGHSHEQPIDQGGSILLGPLPQEVIQHLTPDHADVFIILQGLANLNLLVGRGNHGHLTHLSVYNILWQVKLINHAQRNGATTWLAVVHLSLDEVGFHSILGQLISCTGPSRATTHHGHTQFSALGEVDAGAHHHFGAAQRSFRTRWQHALPLHQAAATAATAGRGGGQAHRCEAAGSEAGAGAGCW